MSFKKKLLTPNFSKLQGNMKLKDTEFSKMKTIFSIYLKYNIAVGVSIDTLG